MSKHNFSLDSECSKQFLQDDDGNYFYGYRLLGRNRDSCLLSNFNFEKACNLLDCALPEGVEVAGWSILRERHWGHGWIETIMVHEHACEQVTETALDIIATLAEYPILSDDEYGALVYDTMSVLWEDMSLRDRIALCACVGESIFMARREELCQLASSVYEKLMSMAEE